MHYLACTKAQLKDVLTASMSKLPGAWEEFHSETEGFHHISTKQYILVDKYEMLAVSSRSDQMPPAYTVAFRVIFVTNSAADLIDGNEQFKSVDLFVVTQTAPHLAVKLVEKK